MPDLSFNFPDFPTKKVRAGEGGGTRGRWERAKTVDQFILCGKYRGAIMTSGRQIDKHLVQFSKPHTVSRQKKASCTST